MKPIIKLLVFCVLAIGLLTCESDDRFYRPRVPQKLSVIAIIDADEKHRYIRFEKTFQVEYPEDLTDSLRDFSFTISDSEGVIHSFHPDGALEIPFIYSFPDSIEFHSGEKYFLSAKERDCPEIYSEISIPEPPSGLNLISFERNDVTDYFHECVDLTWGNPILDVLRIKINKESAGSAYFAILLESIGQPFFDISFYIFRPSFTVRESSDPGFLSVFPGLYSYITDPCDPIFYPIRIPAPAFFIDASKNPGNTISLTLTSQWLDGVSFLARTGPYRIRLLSISNEMYNAMKNLHDYQRNLNDPFSEPVYFKGNVINGHGIFEVCRSVDTYYGLGWGGQYWKPELYPW